MNEDNSEEPESSNASVLSTLTDRPTTLAEAKASPDWPHWEQAIRTEVDKLKRRNTYTVVEHQSDMKVLTGK
jgi:ribosomal RNA methyltransferase Nop2